MKRGDASLFWFFPFSGHILAQSILAAGNIIFNALVSLCKSIIFERVIPSETHCYNFVFVFGFFWHYFGLVDLSS